MFRRTETGRDTEPDYERPALDILTSVQIKWLSSSRLHHVPRSTPTYVSVFVVTIGARVIGTKYAFLFYNNYCSIL